MLDFATDIQDDFAAIVDGLTAVTIVSRDATETEVEHCLRRAVNHREAAASDGKYTTDDVVFHFPTEEAERPELGAVIRDEDGDWTVLEVAKQTLNHRYRCVCRNLVIVAGLDTLVTIQAATFAKGPTGALEPTWSNVATDVLAKIQIESAERDVQHNAKDTPQKATVYFASQQVLTTNNRIVGPDDTIYKVVSWSDADRIDRLFAVQCEVSKWPQS